jgi:hypothetical protein
MHFEVHHMQTGAWRSSVLATLGSLACSVSIALSCWLLGALVFLKVRWTYEPPLEAWLCACLVQIAAEARGAAPGRRIGRAIWVLMGQFGAWALGPVVDARYYRVEELWSLDTGSFGIVTLSLAGGLIGGIVHRPMAAVRRILDAVPIRGAD